MKIPLAALAINDKLVIHANGEKREVSHPIKPFVLAQKDQFLNIQGPVEKWTKVPEYEEREYLRLTFADIENYSDFRKRYIDKQQYILSNSFMEQIYISAPDYMFKHPHTNDLRIMFFDIEVATKGDGFFPKPLTNEVLCIGYSIWVYHNDGTKKKEKQRIVSGFNETDLDKNVLLDFIEAIRTEDPDIIAGYNSLEFDFPYIMDRCQLLGIDMRGIGRDNKSPYIINNELRIPGRIHFDIYNSNSGVIKDQTLFGIKSRSLKELARFYRAKRMAFWDGEWHEDVMDDVEIPEHIENLLKLYNEDPEKLYSYLNDDIFRTECVGHVYLRNCITLAEMMGVPLNSIINMYSSFVPKLFIARNMEKKRLICTESNFQRYNSNNGTIAPLGTKFEGALVGLYKDGYFPQVYKLDFSSMYPSSIQTWNLGPDTTSFVEKLPYSGKYTFKKDSKYNWYRIPDANFKCDIVVKVRNDVEGLLKSEISRLRTERVKIKKQLKSATESERPALDSQQYAVKVILNCFHPNTTILTSNGIKLLKDVKVGELVWSINPNTFEPELKPVEKTYEYDIVDQDLYVINHQRFSQMVTEGHKMLGFRNGSCFFEEAKDFTKRHRVSIPIQVSSLGYPCDIDLLDFVDSSNYELIVLHYQDLRLLKREFPKIKFKKIPTLKEGSLIESKWCLDVKELLDRNYKVLARPKRSKLCSAVPVRVNTLMFSQFVGWYLSEGSLYKSEEKIYQNTIRGVTKKITISQDDINKDIKDEMISVISYMLDSSIKTKLYKNKNGISFSSDLYSELIEKHLGTLTNKHISDNLMNNLHINSVLEAMYQGDGNKEQRRYTISLKYKNLFDSYTKMLILAGKTFTYHIDSGCYRIVDKDNDIVLKKENTSIVKYTGKVYSLTVKNNHTVYAGIDGKMGWIGQSIYGLLGLKSSTYGDMISAMMVTAMCRWTTGKVIRKLEDSLIELDTDGLMLDKPVVQDEINGWLDKLIDEKFGIKDNYMQMELDDFGRAYFYAMKNYIVEENGKYIIHGSSFKASRASHVVDRAIKLAIQHIFNGKPKEEVIYEALDFKKLNLEDFEERVKLSKEPREYDDAYDMRLHLAKQMEIKTGQIAGKGTQLNYVVAKRPLPFPELRPYQKVDGKNYTFVKWIESTKELDMNYYEELVLKALDKFGIKKNLQLNLFGEDFDSRPTKAKKLDVIPKEDMEIENR
jgi:DNA polymerase elongation subunit (family B)